VLCYSIHRSARRPALNVTWVSRTPGDQLVEEVNATLQHGEGSDIIEQMPARQWKWITLRIHRLEAAPTILAFLILPLLRDDVEVTGDEDLDGAMVRQVFVTDLEEVSQSELTKLHDADYLDDKTYARLSMLKDNPDADIRCHR
jgi:hypothetical protein